LRRALPAAALLIVAACATSVLPRESNRMQAGHAPTPFSADKIRAACPDGTWIRFKMESPGAPDAYLVFRFLTGGPEAVTVVSSLFDADDNLTGEPAAKRQKWTDLQSHASFPEVRTRIDPAAFDTPAGRLDGWLYTVSGTKEGRPVLTRYAFARDLPGPPALLEEYTDGNLTLKMVMVGRGIE
jgi:hypothetical protein